MTRLIRSTVVGVVVLAGLAVVPALAGAKPTATTCTDTLTPGIYSSVVVPDNAICVISSGPLLISNGVTVGSGATFVFGAEDTPNVRAVINGGVQANNAANVQIHFASVSGGISIHGGAGAFGGPFGVTFNTIEDSFINGGVTIDGYNGFWMGFIRNNVVGTVNLNNNTLADPDGNEYVTNRIVGGLNCSGNDPAPQVGDSEGALNRVIGPVTGQCLAVV